MDPVLDELAAQAGTLDWQPLRTALVTGLDGRRLAPGTLLGADYVRRQTREPANYGAGVAGLVADGCSTFVELGTESVLTSIGKQWPDTTWIPLRRPGRDAGDSVLTALAELFCRGVEVDWAAAAPTGRRVPLPTYPFQHTPHWFHLPGHHSRWRPHPHARIPRACSSRPSDAHPAAPVSTVSVPPPTPAVVDDAVLTRVCELTAQNLGMNAKTLDPATPFFDLGADSLLMINMLRELESTFAVTVSMRELFDELDSPQRLAEAIVARQPAPTEPPAQISPAAAPVPTIPATPRAQEHIAGSAGARDEPPAQPPTQLGPRP